MPNYQEPYIEPVNGIVQRPFIPPSNKPHRNTNQLQFLSEVVMKEVLEHKFAMSFFFPVNAVNLNIPDYHKVIKWPMDLKTIKKRLDNHYYYSATECIEDYNTMFMNCYVYNEHRGDIVRKAKTLEQVFISKLGEMPLDEIEIPIQSTLGDKGNEKEGEPNCEYEDSDTEVSQMSVE